MPPNGLFRAFLALSLVAVQAVPLRAEDTPPTTPREGVRYSKHWSALVEKYGGVEKIPAEAMFAPTLFDPENPNRLVGYGEKGSLVPFFNRTVNTLRGWDKERQFEHPEYAGFQALLKTQDGTMRDLLKDNPQLRNLMWEAGRPGGEAQLKRLLDGYGTAKQAGSGLTLKDYLKGLDTQAVTAILTGDKVTQKDDDGSEPGAKPGTAKGPSGDQAAKLAGDVLASVGFDGAQAYGVPGDRHVYQDAAGNSISLSVTTRRMPDGTFEDVIHVVNINNRTAPHGATFSLRTEFDKLQAGVPVSVGGVSFTLKLSAAGNDHSISLEGANGPFTNLKDPREPPMSLSDLYAYRAARVFSYGRVVEVGGKEYYVSPETYSQLEGSGDAAKFVGYGQFSYWPKERLDKVFAADAKSGRDEVDPQTVDLKSLDFKSAGFMGPRDIRPELTATVIRREGAQDISYPRVSMGKDSQGRWWDAVLKDGQYTVQPGTEPKPGAPGFPAPPEEETALGRFGQGVPSDWAAVLNRRNEPLVPAPGFPVPPGGSPGVAAYVGKEGDVLYIRSSFKDAAGTIWTSGPQEAFALKPGVPNRPPLPQAQLRPAPFVTDVAIGPILSSMVHVFDGGQSGYMVFETRASLESADYVPIGIPIVWGDRFATPQAAFDYHREHPKEGLDYLTPGGAP